MAYRKESHYTDHDERPRIQRPKYTAKHTEQPSAPSRHYERQTRLERGDRVQSPRRKRIATGYIDRSNYPSNPYISSRSRASVPSPDSEYITRPRFHDDDYIQPRDHYGKYDHVGPYHRSENARWNVQAFASKEDFMRSHGFNHHRDEDFEETTDHRRTNAQHKQYGSDVEDRPHNREADQQHTRARSYDSEEGSDIVTEKRTTVGSDVASIHSRRSSCSKSDRRSIRSLAVGSDVLERRRDDGSESDSEGGYISLDDYIGGGSDCVSKRSLSEDEGEGSDAVGSEVGHGSDIADASDVEDFDDGEDCISDDEIDRGHARSGIAYRAWERGSRV